MLPKMSKCCKTGIVYLVLLTTFVQYVLPYNLYQASEYQYLVRGNKTLKKTKTGYFHQELACGQTKTYK